MISNSRFIEISIFFSSAPPAGPCSHILIATRDFGLTSFSSSVVDFSIPSLVASITVLKVPFHKLAQSSPPSQLASMNQMGPRTVVAVALWLLWDLMVDSQDLHYRLLVCCPVELGASVWVWPGLFGSPDTCSRCMCSSGGDNEVVTGGAPDVDTMILRDLGI